METDNEESTGKPPAEQSTEGPQQRGHSALDSRSEFASTRTQTGVTQYANAGVAASSGISGATVGLSGSTSIRATGATEAPDIADIRGHVELREALWENVRVQRSLLEATLRAQPAPRVVGPDHNGGPSLVPNAVRDLLAANELIDLLKDEGPRPPRSKAIVAAETAAEAAKNGNGALNEFAMGIVKGAGLVVGERALNALMETSWWTAFYARLAELAEAVLKWAAHLVG